MTPPPLPWLSHTPATPDATPDDPDLWFERPRPRVAPNTASWLSALRRTEFNRQVADAKTRGRTLVVTTYVVGPRSDQDRLRQPLVQYAGEQEWRVHRRSFADESLTEALREGSGLHQACVHASSGYVRGILTAGRFMITPDDAAYESILRWLADRATFLTYPSPLTRAYQEAVKP
ncbi:hypothetical protein [Streptomyces anulatus]|uniref:hypothetical protein n=1 Tax=Streptomyces anulatus TaxID=1892 RepID=UPI0036600BB0